MTSSPAPANHNEERIVVFGSVSGASWVRLLEGADYETRACFTLADVCSSLTEGVGALLLEEESLTKADQQCLFEVLAAQPPWSDLPIIVAAGESGGASSEERPVVDMGPLANVTFLEHLAPERTLLNAIHAALRARRRQYQSRALLRDLAASELRFREVQEKSPQGMMILRPVRDEGSDAIVDFRWVYANPTSARTIAMTNEELVGKSILSERPNVLTERRFDAYVRAFESGNNESEYREFLSVRGSDQRSYRNVAFRMEGDLVILFEDFTERKRAEEARSGLLEIEQELRARAEAANRLKDEFVATMSHELRTPLNAILGWARMLNEGGLDAMTIERALQSIERNALAQTQLVEDLLEVSRIAAGELRIDRGEVRLHQVIRAAVDALQPTLDRRQMELRMALDAKADRIIGDTTRLQRVVWNLLSNAAKFGSRGGHIVVELTRRNEQVELSVSDDGQGFDESFRPHLFQRFRQADGTHTRSHGGLGLGLAICRHLVELHGGTVDAHSDGPGRGARFLITLPVAPTRLVVEEPEQAQIAKRPTSRFEAPSELRGLRVLLVDDEADARELLVMVLNRCGAITVEAGSVAEAMNAMQTDRLPDIVVSDIGMPKEDGYELIRRIRSLPETKGGRVPAAALTAFAHRDDRKKALNAGFEMHIAKPVEPSELVTSLATLARMGMTQDYGK